MAKNNIFPLLLNLHTLTLSWSVTHTSPLLSAAKKLGEDPDGRATCVVLFVSKSIFATMSWSESTAQKVWVIFVFSYFGTIIDAYPVNRNQKADQIPIRTPTSTGLQGDAPGKICTDGTYLYVCVGTYNGSSTIWGKVTLTAV